MAVEENKILTLCFMLLFFSTGSEKSGSRKKLGQIDGSIYEVDGCMIPCFLIFFKKKIII